MASNCPNCGKKLKWYHIKAECSACGANIPNYNWEARLEEDNIKAEERFAALYKKLNLLRYSVYGTRLRIARIFMSLIPALGFILPWAYITSEKDSLYFDLIGIFTDGKSTLDFIMELIKDIGGFISSINGPLVYIMGGLGLMLLSIVSIVIAFFLIFIRFTKPKTNAVWIADFISILFATASVAVFGMAGSALEGAETFFITSFEFTGASAGFMWGSFVYIALLAVALVGNLLVSRSAIKSEEELESERLERVRIKEEKAEAERIRKEAERAEARKKADEEQAEKVRKAKEALENSKNK